MNLASLPTLRRLLAATATFAVAGPVLAHHAMDGKMPSTFDQGLLSGLAHPVIGLDHLAFVLAVAWLVATLAPRLRAGLAAAFVGGSVMGTFVHLQSVDVPAPELLVALTVLVGGLLLAWRRTLPSPLLWIALPIAGVLHGYAYGESIVGAETTPLSAYLLGFSLVQLALIVGVSTLLSRQPSPRLQRSGLVAGLAVALVGAYFVAAQLAPAVA